MPKITVKNEESVSNQETDKEPGLMSNSSLSVDNFGMHSPYKSSRVSPYKSSRVVSPSNMFSNF
jgi:hypothetical protein